jgi:aspartate carbamoyltransferase catalytic subunit
LHLPLPGPLPPELRRKDLLDIESMLPEQIDFILQTSRAMKEVLGRSMKKFPALRGRSVLNLFYEPSTRTRTSFEIAAKNLSADVTNFPVAQSSVTKGESILDTIDTLQSMKVDFLVVRHGASGVPNYIARHTQASVINAGDGHHAHPTQALLDAHTLREVLGEDLRGRRLVICGDIRHSRVARSVSTLCHKLGLQLGVFAPEPLLPPHRHAFLPAFRSFTEVMDWKPDVIYLLRLQLERQEANYFPSTREYHQIYGVTAERLRRLAGDGVYIMHPGPVNRGLELCDGVMTYPRTLINRQVENGVAVRMATLYWLQPGIEARPTEPVGEPA